MSRHFTVVGTKQIGNLIEAVINKEIEDYLNE